MKTYLISCSDWQRMEERPDIISQQFEVLLSATVKHFAPVLFAEYSGLTQYVHEEIDLVISAQTQRNGARLDYDSFVAFWGWTSKLESKVYALSGGWRKALACSLFINQRFDNLLFVDFSSHFSDQMMTFLLSSSERLGVAHCAFVEYDDSILATKLAKPHRLMTSGQRLTERP